MRRGLVCSLQDHDDRDHVVLVDRVGHLRIQDFLGVDFRRVDEPSGGSSNGPDRSLDGWLALLPETKACPVTSPVHSKSVI